MSTARGWPLVLLVLVAGTAALNELFDLDAFKLGLLGLVVAAGLLPWLLWRGRAELLAWLGSSGALLYLLSVAWSLQGSWRVVERAAVADRLLGVALALVAGTLGLMAALRARGALRHALLLVGFITSVVAILQSLGIEHWMTTSPDEVVALMGNSTRAGALLALVVCAAFAAVVSPDLREPHWRLRLAAWTLTLGTTALLLTRARGGWLAAACGLAVVALTARAGLAAHKRTWGLHLLIGIALALILSDGPARLLSSKLDAEAPLLSAQDVTTQVRLSVWSGTLDLAADEPLVGWGLGRFRESFPPYRDAAEAALPGLAGAQTEVDHPHNEFLLALAEGGWLAAVALAAFALATLLRAARRVLRDPTPDDGGCGDRVVLGVLVAGLVAAMLQNAWVSPGTLVPLFAAAGWAWAPATLRTPSRGASLALGAGLLLAMAGLVILALPRVRVQLGLRDFYLHANAEGRLTPHTLGLLTLAAEADPNDVDAQRLLLSFASLALESDERAGPAVRAAIERAQLRIARLAPHSQ